MLPYQDLWQSIEAHSHLSDEQTWLLINLTGAGITIGAPQGRCCEQRRYWLGMDDVGWTEATRTEYTSLLDPFLKPYKTNRILPLRRT